ncbi:zinc-dependent alcohol dehydrogenase [Corticicoccus populi]|uniref:Alcohol dehydrogenase catalytic domain-containing protein n=1 Tax=Corticicoccus populi TaxID=1812821 RepID=A0ABW5WZ68_9STAP
MISYINESLKVINKKEMAWQKENIPPLKADEILIKTTATAVSTASELAVYNNHNTSIPVQSGYESVGIIVDVGTDISLFKIGDRVLSFYGHQTFSVLNENQIIKIPDDISTKTALLAILSCDSAKGAVKINPQTDDHVIITGAGTMGLLTLFYLKNKYHIKRVDIIDPDVKRLTAAELLDADEVYTYSPNGLENTYDTGFECSDNDSAFRHLQKLVKPNAAICVLSDGNNGSFNLSQDFFDKELSIVKSNDGYNYHAHADWLFSIEQNKLKQLNNIFDMEVHQTDLITLFEHLDNQTVQPIKVLVHYSE